MESPGTLGVCAHAFQHVQEQEQKRPLCEIVLPRLIHPCCRAALMVQNEERQNGHQAPKETARPPDIALCPRISLRLLRTLCGEFPFSVIGLNNRL
jgi:hypothetical protein